MGPKSNDQTKNKWSNEQITTLIDTYKSESCLYAVNSPNYHNKYLRSEALKRVGDAVRTWRPNDTDKECATKLHTLRTQYNIERAKVKASTKSGTGTDNIYKPGLWYYEHLTFLDAYYTPRKSKSSLEMDVNTEETSSQLQGSIHIVSEGFTEDGSLNVFLEEESDDSALDVRSPPPPSQSPAPQIPTQCSSAAAASLNVFPLTTSLSAPNIICPSPSVNPARSASSGKASYQPRAAKRKASSEDSYVGAITSLAESLRQPIVISDTKSDSTPVTLPVEDGITGCLTFLGSVIRSIQNEELRLDLIHTLVQTTINARTYDLERSRNKH